jgi:hypothetical protein
MDSHGAVNLPVQLRQKLLHERVSLLGACPPSFRLHHVLQQQQLLWRHGNKVKSSKQHSMSGNSHLVKVVHSVTRATLGHVQLLGQSDSGLAVWIVHWAMLGAAVRESARDSDGTDRILGEFHVSQTHSPMISACQLVTLALINAKERPTNQSIGVLNNGDFNRDGSRSFFGLADRNVRQRNSERHSHPMLSNAAHLSQLILE